jgi:hypothetical protein
MDTPLAPALRRPLSSPEVIAARLADHHDAYPQWKLYPLLQLVAERYESFHQLALDLRETETFKYAMLSSLSTQLSHFFNLSDSKIPKAIERDKKLVRGLMEVFGLTHEDLFTPMPQEEIEVKADAPSPPDLPPGPLPPSRPSPYDPTAPRIKVLADPLKHYLALSGLSPQEYWEKYIALPNIGSRERSWEEFELFLNEGLLDSHPPLLRMVHPLVDIVARSYGARAHVVLPVYMRDKSIPLEERSRRYQEYWDFLKQKLWATELPPLVDPPVYDSHQHHLTNFSADCFKYPNCSSLHILYDLAGFRKLREYIYTLNATPPFQGQLADLPRIKRVMEHLLAGEPLHIHGKRGVATNQVLEALASRTGVSIDELLYQRFPERRPPPEPARPVKPARAPRAPREPKMPRRDPNGHFIWLPKDGLPFAHGDLEDLILEMGRDLKKVVALLPPETLTPEQLEKYMRHGTGGGREGEPYTDVENAVFELVRHYRTAKEAEHRQAQRELTGRAPTIGSIIKRLPAEAAAQEVKQDMADSRFWRSPQVYRDLITKNHYNYTKLAKQLNGLFGVTATDLQELANALSVNKDFYAENGDYKNVVKAAYHLIVEYYKRKESGPQATPPIQNVFGESPHMRADHQRVFQERRDPT